MISSLIISYHKRIIGWFEPTLVLITTRFATGWTQPAHGIDDVHFTKANPNSKFAYNRERSSFFIVIFYNVVMSGRNYQYAREREETQSVPDLPLNNRCSEHNSKRGYWDKPSNCECLLHVLFKIREGNKMVSTSRDKSICEPYQIWIANRIHHFNS